MIGRSGKQGGNAAPSNHCLKQRATCAGEPEKCGLQGDGWSTNRDVTSAHTQKCTIVSSGRGYENK